MQKNGNESEYENLVAELCYFVHRKCKPSWKIDNAPLGNYDLIYVVNGKVEYIIDGVTYLATRGDLLYIPKGKMRRAFTFDDDPSELYSASFELYNMSEHETNFPLLPIKNIGIQQDIISWFNNINYDWCNCDRGYRMKVRAWLMFIINRCLQLSMCNDSHVTDSRIDKIKQYVLKHYAENLSIQKLCPQFGISRYYLGSMFHQVTGMSFRQYLLNVRLNIAEEMLLSGEYNVSYVAAACGFSDVFYFSRVFKKSRGKSPSLMSTLDLSENRRG
jgi:AraC-type DNA-binding domain-containing proteins